MIRNFDAEKQLKEAWNSHYDKEYEVLLKTYKEQGYKIKRNDKTGDHLVSKEIKNNQFGYGNPFSEIFGNIFNGGRV